jgi:TolA-binding protein
MVDLLHNLSSLRIQLRQACGVAETLKQQALESEARGDPFKALELMSDTHNRIVEIRSLEERIEGVKQTIVQRQQQKMDIRNFSRNSNKMG